MALLLLLAAAPPVGAAVAAPPALLQPCRLPGVEHGALCGVVRRPLDPTLPQGLLIDVHVAVLPALARNKKPDPVFFFAGGPGQSAIELAGPIGRMLSRLQNRRDIVLIDQRGTGRSAPLKCADEAPTRPLAEQLDPQRQLAQIVACRTALQALPHGDLRQYTTALAMQDADAVRRALGAERINLVGASYGTRAALDYMRQFPQAVRRAVLDGVVSPDMRLPEAAAADAQAAFDALLAACQAEPACEARHPALRDQWAQLLAGLPRAVVVAHPITGREEKLVVSRDMITSLVRQVLYVPALASALPVAIAEAAQGRLAPLVGLAGAMGSGRRAGALAQGMHFSVICTEDAPSGGLNSLSSNVANPGTNSRPNNPTNTPPNTSPNAVLAVALTGVVPRADAAGRSADFGDGVARLYRQVCAEWPRGVLPAGFGVVARAPGATLLMSGGIDPATPPRHGERVALALGPLARHEVVPNAGHGVLGLPCQRDVLFRFIDADSDGLALQVDTGCAAAIPRPPAFVPVQAPDSALVDR